MVLPYRGQPPTIPDTAFVAPNATVIGDVVVGEHASIWFNAVVRGDIHAIRIGARANIQDGAILHVTYQKQALQVGAGVTVGHGAILHGCTIEDDCLIGMGARILDGAYVGRFSLVAAGSLVREGETIPERSLVAGVPAIVKRSLTDAEVEAIQASAERYVRYKETYRQLCSG